MSDFALEKQPNPTGVGTPTSGTYGEGVALENLKKSLPTVDPSAPAVQGPTSGSPMPPPPQPYGGGLPQGMFGPTQRPNVPGSTALEAAPTAMPGAQTPGQRNLAVLDVLIQSPEVSDETREWAQMVRMQLIEGSRA